MTHARSDARSDAKVMRWSDEGSNARSDAWECRVVGCVLVSTNIYNAQLSRMSHCAPVARKPICLEFTPEAAVGNILVA